MPIYGDRLVFQDRKDAAALLAAKLEERYGSIFAEKGMVIVLAIPRGGVVTGDIIASHFGVKLDVVVSRKVGAPENPELAIGAVMHDGSFYPNSEIISVLGVPQQYIDEQVAAQMKEIQRRLSRFRGGSEYRLTGMTAFLVDDGIATGATMFAAINWLAGQRLKKLVVAVPVGPRDTIYRLGQIVEDVVVLQSPVIFGAVGEFYRDFAQVTDEEVMQTMRKYV